MKIINKFIRAIFVVFPIVIGAACFADEQPIRLDVSVQPEDAQVFVDNVARGAAPVSIFDLKPGKHLVHIEAPSYVAQDDIVVVAPGDYIQKAYTLNEERALILIRSQPSGADVRYNGVSIGETPLLITSFATGKSYPVELNLTGYQKKKINLVPEGRKPLVLDEALVLDSGVINCSSEPIGATVVVNGIERGVTPIKIENVPKGLATVTMKLAGYQDETRELRLAPGDEQSLSLKMKGKPARLKIVSSPEQARVFVDGDYQGKTPVTIPALVAGSHEIRIELAGFGDMTRKIEVANGQELTEEFALTSVLGRLEIVTIPAGAKISVDGKAVGTTRSQGGDIQRSQVLLLNKIPAGMHSILAHLDGYQDAVRRVKVSADTPATVVIKLRSIFIPDTRVETTTGTRPYVGVLISNGPEGLELETKPGIRQTFRPEDIRKVEPINH